MHDFADFLLAAFHESWTQQRWSVRRWKLSDQNFKNFTVRGRFLKKRKNGLRNVQVLRLHAAIYNYAMITDHPKLTTKIALYGI